MFDINTLKNRTGATISYRNRVIGPYEFFSFKGERGLVQAGAATYTYPGDVIKSIYVEREDQTDYTNRPEVHRYFYPSFVGGDEKMLNVPKAVMYFDSHADYGEVLFVRYYFWCDYGAIDSLTSSNFTVKNALSKASDVVTEVFPLPEDKFIMPLWQNLPEDFNLRTQRSRRDPLMARARS